MPDRIKDEEVMQSEPGYAIGYFPPAAVRQRLLRVF
jgi:hypothetical protein